MSEKLLQAKESTPKQENGYVALTVTLLTMIVSLTIIGGFTFFALQEARTNTAFTKSVESRYIAEGGIEDMVYRVVSGKQYSASETLDVGNGTTTLTVSTSGTQKTIRSAGKRDNFQQNLETKVTIATDAVGFYYGAQVGDGGITMEQNSSVSGGVFSNGSIIGDNGAIITGDAFAAGASAIRKVTVSGNAQAHLIDDSTVGGYASSTTKLDDTLVGLDAHTNELDDATVNNNAYYNVTDAQSVVLGSRITPTVPPADLTSLALPITQSKIDQWKSDAEQNGVIASGTCSQNWSPPTNPYTVNGGVLEKSLNLDNNQILILKGTVWVKCDVDVSNGAAIRLDPGYGQTSGMLIADGRMHLRNNGVFQGSGDPCNCSYIMLLTTAGGGGHHGSAIDLHNNASGTIFYAGNGLVYLHPNVEVMQLTARAVHLENNATLVYELGVASANFSSGPSSGSDIQYWKRVE